MFVAGAKKANMWAWRKEAATTAAPADDEARVATEDASTKT